MLFFLDTEFTDFDTMDLISVGIVSANGQDGFYFERTDHQREVCSTFVQSQVLPLLGGPAALQGTDADLIETLAQWLGQQVGFDGKRPGETAVIACDFKGDARLLQQRLHQERLMEHGVKMPRFLDCNGLINTLVFQTSFGGPTALRRHHALDDAEALRRAHVQWVGNRPTPLDTPLATWTPAMVQQAPWFTFDTPPMNRSKLWERWQG